MKVKDVIRYGKLAKQIIDNEKEVSALIKFKLLGIAKQCQPVASDYETIREEKIAKYGSTNDQGVVGIFAPKEDDFEDKKEFEDAVKKYESVIDDFYKELNEILESESDVEIKKFKSDDIMNAGLSSDCLLALYDLIEE